MIERQKREERMDRVTGNVKTLSETVRQKERLQVYESRVLVEVPYIPVSCSLIMVGFERGKTVSAVA